MKVGLVFDHVGHREMECVKERFVFFDVVYPLRMGRVPSDHGECILEGYVGPV